jgi:light-regulated signal transduction histidine kinase (bacteriophytochrome)
MCELSIEDNGIGFEDKYLEKIFAVFQRLHGRTEYEGTGVGLAVCRRITDRHHGTITARSQLGKGSTFIVTLPFRRPTAQK